MRRVVVIGTGAREDAIAQACVKSEPVELGIFGLTRNPALEKVAAAYHGAEKFIPGEVVAFAKEFHATLAIIGPEAPLAAGVADGLRGASIPVVGPTQAAAQLETSKAFTRNLLKEENIPLYPAFAVVRSLPEFEDWISQLPGEFVVKPDGLTGGKGVKVQGDDFISAEEGKTYAAECLKKDGRVVVEEKLVGQEFSLMSFSDGEHVLHMPAVQDNKRLQGGDKGPNTGGMGSVSDANHTLPFLNPEDITLAQRTNERVVRAMKKRGLPYHGILYGNYIAVKDGLKLIEYNARFGDPEAMNVLSTLESNFLEICEALCLGKVHQVSAEFARQATVCKYVVPRGYPDSPVKNEVIDISAVDRNRVNLFLGAVEEKQDKLYLTGSRAVAVVGKAQTITEAERIVEEEIAKIIGPVIHRTDIGTQKLLKKRMVHMQKIRQTKRARAYARP